MRSVTIARNYAEALFTLGEQADATAAYGELIEALAAAIRNTPRIGDLLLSPRVPKLEKVRLIGEGLKGAPKPFRLFVQAVVKRLRAPLLSEIAVEYARLLDEKLGRVRAGVTLVQEPDAALSRAIEERLSTALGKQVIARFSADAEILGGTIVRIGDRIYDGSVRRRMARLRRQLLG
ncbi:MAG TPA: ATP synthase F1 subunit delta [Gemmatimonadales bacterium]|nr:ATP synthase F1 subunit delta [Gemmatimonadales bacterium]